MTKCPKCGSKRHTRIHIEGYSPSENFECGSGVSEWSAMHTKTCLVRQLRQLITTWGVQEPVESVKYAADLHRILEGE